MSSSNDPILLSFHGKIALLTLNLPKKLNALTQPLYYQLATHLCTIAARPDIYITILTARGRYFSAGADVQASGFNESDDPAALRKDTMRSFAANNLDVTNAFYTHPKILITALNGPVIGLSAALISLSDFIYATPNTFLLTPFTSLGLVAEGATSVSLVQRLGISKANEALIMSKRIGCEELEKTGFVNKVFRGVKDGDNERFMEEVMREVQERLGDHLNSESLVKVKELIRKPMRRELDQANLDEVFMGVERFVIGAPQKEFADIRNGKKRHKL